MRIGSLSKSAVALVIALALTSCGGNGKNPGDIVPGQPATASAVTGPNSFLLFPNPLKQSDGTLETNTAAYTNAYYAAIDPNNKEDTLAKWKQVNGFGTATTSPLGEVTVVVGDQDDLGYGRRMTIRQNSDGTIAAMVNNYVVTAGTTYGTYDHLSVEAAAIQDNRWFIGTTAIEYSPAPGVSPGANCFGCFAKFSFFDKSGNRASTVNLDGRGMKAMPGPCISCHGGRAPPLTPATGSPTGLPLFGLLQNSDSLARGDVQGQLHDLKVGTFDFSTMSGYTRADEEAKLKTANQIVLCSYPYYQTTPTVAAEDVCRPLANMGWYGGNDVFIKQPYGGDGMPNAVYNDTYVPPGWTGQTALYQNVVQPYCRTCHILRGMWAMSDVDFTDTVPYAATDGYTKFSSYSDRIYDHVFNRGNMPLAKIVSDRFWSGTGPDTLATWLEGLGLGYVAHDGSGKVLKPGRPIAEPGPDRTTDSPATLSAADSMYATSYAWSIASGPPSNDGVLTNANTAQATLTATVKGTYVLQLIVSNGSMQSAPATVNVDIEAPGTLVLPIAAKNIHFSDIKAFLQSTVPGCTGCHSNGTTSLATWSYGPPILYDNVDRNGDGTVDSGTPGSIDDLWFYTELRGRLNFTDIDASPLLLKPTGHHHGGGLVIDTSSTTACSGTTSYPACQPYATLGDYYKAQYNKIVLWALNGAPQ